MLQVSDPQLILSILSKFCNFMEMFYQGFCSRLLHLTARMINYQLFQRCILQCIYAFVGDYGSADAPRECEGLECSGKGCST